MRLPGRILALMLTVLLGLTAMSGCVREAGASAEIYPTRDADSQEDGVSEDGRAESESEPIAVTETAAWDADAAPLPEFSDTEEYRAVCRAVNGLSFRLTDALLADGGENLVCSPLSAAFALSTLLNGVGDETVRRALLDSLGFDGMDMDSVNRGFAMLLSRLTVPTALQLEEMPEYKTAVSLANAVFVSRDYTLNADFSKAALDSYRARTFSVDFQSQNAAQTINDWCRVATDGVIPSVVDELDPDTAAAIAGAIHFSDLWEREFDSSDNEELSFHADSGDTTATFLCRHGLLTEYLENDSLQAANLPFERGGGLILLLPKSTDGSGSEAARRLLADMDADSFESLLSSFGKRNGVLRLPRFRTESSLSLSGALRVLGLGSLFDSAALPIDSLAEESPLCISDALQKASIEVSETGTTAAAVTVITMFGTAIEYPDTEEPFEMTCDRPFAFVLYSEDGTILFTGVCGNPSAD